MIAGSPDEAMAAAKRSNRRRRSHPRPACALVRAFCLRVRLPRRQSCPRAGRALRRGRVIAQDSRNRAGESALAQTLSRIEAEHGDPVAALDHLTIAIRNYHDSGNTTMIRSPLAILARLSRMARTLRAGGHHRRLRVQSPHRSVGAPNSAPRSPTSAMSSATRPTNRSPARASHSGTVRRRHDVGAVRRRRQTGQEHALAR